MRYVNPSDNLVREDLIHFMECDTCVCGSSLVDKILGCLQKCGLDINKRLGQAYGAGNGRQHHRNSSNHHKEVFSAIYMRCASHCVNLAPVNSLKVASV